MGLPAHDERVRPRHAPVWIRVDGDWRSGSIHNWFKMGDYWAIWAQHQDPDGGAHPVWGAFIVDPDTVVPRYGGDPPP